MAGSTFGKHFTVTTWGESHGKALGVVVDGVPAGIPIDEAVIQGYMDRRRPGQSRFTTARKEGDELQILSGVFEGRTTGTPISMLVFNEDQRSRDYSDICDTYRPGHADFCMDNKYGFRDYRGGGRSSGRETLARVAAGAIAGIFLKELGIGICAYTRQIGPHIADAAGITSIYEAWSGRFDLGRLGDCARRNSLYMIDEDTAQRAEQYIDEVRSAGDSCGGVVECIAQGLPVGLGEPVFDKLDALLGQALFSIGAVKGVEVGVGFLAAGMRGSVNNDPFIIREGRVSKSSNNSGGVLGGMSDSSPLIVRAAIKPTPSISIPQKTVKSDGTGRELSIKGRHDPIIVPRAVVVVESMCAITIADLLLRNMCANMDNVRRVYCDR